MWTNMHTRECIMFHLGIAVTVQVTYRLRACKLADAPSWASIKLTFSFDSRNKWREAVQEVKYAAVGRTGRRDGCVGCLLQTHVLGAKLGCDGTNHILHWIRHRYKQLVSHFTEGTTAATVCQLDR
jgi:hypothetical protein